MNDVMEKNGLSIIGLLLAGLVGGGVSYAFIKTAQPVLSAVSTETQTVAKPAALCSYAIARVSGFNRVRPLLFSEPTCESPRLEGLRTSVGALVDGFKASGQVISASVYIRDFRKAEWTLYNGAEEYDPGSLLKVPMLLCYMSMSEADPTVLKQVWTCEQHDFDVPQNTAFPSAQAELNKAYTVQQLLELAIVNSDNRATIMLLRHLSPARYLHTFTQLGLHAPDWNAKTYRMNVRDYSVFMKALYNSALLGPMNSEYALELMSRADFKKGLLAGLPPDIDIAHKFGEAGDQNEKQLHETGLVYAQGNPYLITVMTRGANVDSLASAIASVSRLVYDRMRTP